MNPMQPQHLWGGRFTAAGCRTNASMTDMNSSLSLDARLYDEDITGSKAYAEALERAGHLTRTDCDRLLRGLETVRAQWRSGGVELLPTDEDIHTANERLLGAAVGDVAQRLHTGRSRNDQVVTDLKLWLRKSTASLTAELVEVIKVAVGQAEQHLGVLMPGYTHMQRAQPVQFAHWLLSHAFALREDCMRLSELRVRANVLPLGSGALAGNPLGIDRLWLAQRLGFSSVTQNSMHAVGDRDFVVDLVYCCALTSLHLSRLAEDLIIFATKEFDFIEIADDFSTGSSLMPQKRNPDSLELVRGVSGSICACLTGIMMTIKGTPSTYNKDLQFDKQYCFEAYDKLVQALTVTRGVIGSMRVKRDQMETALSPDMLATDWAYYLVRKGVPFRKAHHYIGQVVAHAEKMGLTLTEIPYGELMEICPHFEVDILKVADYGTNLEKYQSIGGTATEAITEQLKVLKEFVESLGKQFD